MKISVELDVFSGRLNPAWEIVNEEAQHLNNLLQNLPSLQSPVPADGLGYRGFIITVNDGDKAQMVHVYAGRVWLDTNINKVFIDQNQVEQMLMQMAKKMGYRDLLKSLGVD